MVAKLMTRPRHITQSHGKRPQSLGQLAIGQQLGRYQVLAELASGGMAVVHVASAQGAAGFERLVALKVLHTHLACEEEFIKMFLDEARLAAGIRHPNVVSTIDISDSLETGYFLVMEYVEGDHLGALLSSAHKRGERLPLPVVMRILIDALAGLGAAHDLRDGSGKALQLVHRDVSPHNVMVGCDGVSRLTDFGVAKAEDRLTQTRHGEVKGKLSYMAPEQASSGVSDRRSDLFSVGIMLWEAVTGRRLFRGETVSATLNKLLSNKIAPPSAIDPTLAPFDALLRKALAHDPALRFNTAEEFSDALEQTARDVGGVASWRGVSDAVNEYAAEKLARERKLISAAKLVLAAPRSGVEFNDAPAVEAAPSKGAVSLESVGGARSEPSGVFSNATAPGRRMRNTRSPEASPQTGGDGRAPKGPPPLPPEIAKSQTPPPVPRSIARSLRSGSAAAVGASRKAQQRRTALGMGMGAALLLGGWLTWSLRSAPAQHGLQPLAGGEIGRPLRVDDGEPAATAASAAHLVAPRPTQEAVPLADTRALVWPPAVVPTAAAPAPEAEIKTPPVPTRGPAIKARSSRTRTPKRVRKPVSTASAGTQSPRVRPPLPNPYKL